MLKILHAKFQHYVNQELLDVQAGFRKGRGTRDQIANIYWITEKARGFQKNIYLCFTDYTKAFDSLNHNKLWKFLKEMGINTTPPYLPPEKHMQVKKQQNWTRNNGLAQIWERSTSRLYFVTLLI